MNKRTNTAKWTGTRWRIDVQKDGTRKSFYSSRAGMNGQREANAKADAWLDDGLNPTSPRVSELFEAFVEAQKLRTSKASWIKTESFGETWLLPAIGNKRLSSVTEQDLQEIIDQAYKEGRSRKTLQNYVGHINAFYKFCRMSKYTKERPEGITVPANARNKGHTILQPDSLATLFDVDTTLLRGKIVRDDLVGAYRFAVLTGLRPGELRALKWSALDGNKLHVSGAINQLNEHTNGKNENAIRTIVLPPLALQVLQMQRAYTWEDEYIFPIGSMQNYNRRWTVYSKTNGLPHTTLYEMRHTFVSICKSLPESQLKALVGHSAAMDTLGIYGHEVNGEAEATAQSVEKLFENILISK